MIEAFGLTSIPRKANPPAVDDVSFEARAGRVTALLGAQGAGKSTALRLMLELQPGRGITYFRGRPLHRIAHPSREVGVLLGDVPGHPARSVRGHLRMLCAATGVPARRADEILEVVGLRGLREERLSTLSRGMDRRLGLACALLPDPHTLVLDTPTRGVSGREARWMHGMLRAHAAQGGTVLYTTDDPKEAAGAADQVITLDGGRLVADQGATEFGRTRLRPRVAVRSPHAARLAALLAKEARTARLSVEVVQEGGNRLSVYGSTTADVGETAFRNNILIHQLAHETGDMGPGAGTRPTGGHAPVGESARTDRSEPSREPARKERTEPGGDPRTADHPRIPGGRLAVDRPEAADRVAPAAGSGTADHTAPAARSEATDRPAALARTDALGASVGAEHPGDPDSPPTMNQSEPSEGAPAADRPHLDRPHLLDCLPAREPEQPFSTRPVGDRGQAATRPPATHWPSGTASPDSSIGPLPEEGARFRPDADVARAATAQAADDGPSLDGPGSGSPAPPPISVRTAPTPLRPLRYEVRRATGIATGFLICGAVLVVSAITAALLARLGHTEPTRLFVAWPRELPLPPAALGAGLLGAMAFGDEFRHPSLAADRGTVPRRLGLLTAKLLVSAVTALLLAFLTVGCDAEVLYLLYGRELTQVPVDWFSTSVSWFGLVAGCAWAGVLAAGVFRSTTAGLAAVLAVPVVVVPLVHRVLDGQAVRMTTGLSVRVRELRLLQWPFGGERYLAGAARALAQPVGGALTLSLTVLLCAYVLTSLRSKFR